MKNKLPVLSLATFLILIMGISNVYSQWALNKGEGGLIMSLRYYQSTEFYDALGNKLGATNDGKFSKYELGGFYGVGLGKGWGLFTGFSFAALRYEDKYIDNKSAGFTNPTVGIIYQFTDFPAPIFGLAFSINLPLNFPKNEAPELGANFFEFELNPALGGGFKIGKNPGFWSLGVAGKYRANEYDEFQYRAYSNNGFDIIREKLQLFVGLEFAKSTNRPFRSFKLGGTLLYKVSKSVGIGGFYENLIEGQDIGTGPSAGLTLWYNYK